MKMPIILVLISSISVSVSTPALAAKLANPKCSELSQIDRKYTPQYLAVIDGYNSAGKQIMKEVDIGSIVSESGPVKDECEGLQTAEIETVRTDVSLQSGGSSKSLVAAATVNPKTTLDFATAKCRDFIALSETLQPVAAFWVAGQTQAGKVKSGEVDQEFLSRPMATLIEQCKANPKVSFYEKTKKWLEEHI